MAGSNEQLCKVFVGGLTREANEQSLKESFSSYGNIVDVSVMRDPQQRSRGFGFVVFDNPSCVDDIMKAKKDGRVMLVDNGLVEVKRALPRTERGDLRDRTSSRQAGIKRTFVGGLSTVTRTEDLEEYFSKFGRVLEANVMMDKTTDKSRGFGFVTFEDEDAADKVCALKNHEVNGKLCEVRKAESRQSMNSRRDRDQMRSSPRYHQDYNVQPRLPNVGLDTNNLNSAVQLLSSLQTIVNASQLQQSLSQGNQIGNLNQGQIPSAPVQNQMAPNANQNNILQLLQTALTGQNMQNPPQQNIQQSPAAAQPNNQLGLLLNALQGNNTGAAGANIGQANLSGLLGSLAGQNSANAIKPEPLNTNVGYPMQGTTAASGTEAPTTPANQSMSYYDDNYGSQSQYSSGYGPVRYPQSRSETKPNVYRPY